MTSNSQQIDILVITYRRPHYTRQCLERLLAGADESVRLWIWHNGPDEETLAVSRSFAHHPRVHQFHHSEENRALRDPTNWVWENATGGYVSKVDDDCLLPRGWAQTLRSAHETNPKLGAIGSWRFQDEDYLPDLAKRKTIDLEGGHQLMVNCWVQGSGYLMKRACIDDMGLLPDDGNFTRYCNQLARHGWVNGYYFPFIQEDHMDDPRSPNTGLRTTADLERFKPLSAERFGINTLEKWLDDTRQNAFAVQYSTTNPFWYQPGWRIRLYQRYMEWKWKQWRPRMAPIPDRRGESA